MLISPLGDAAAVITLGETVDPGLTARGRAIAAEIERHLPTGVVDVVPAFASVAVFFDPAHAAGFAELKTELAAAVSRADLTKLTGESRLVEIPVCYGGEYGPDLETVAIGARLSRADVVAQHSGAEYLVHAIGFSPGFPYLGGLPAALATPRRATPRAQVAAGSVGIGGGQTGIYPRTTPGGWNLIGRTPLALFDAKRRPPALLESGDRVRFRPVSAAEFTVLEAKAPGASDGKTDTTAGLGPADLRDDAGNGGGEGAVAGSLPSIRVLRPGMFTTVQDGGRRGHRARGVPLSGAADPFALRLVNALVGNPDDAAALEFTLVGPELRFSHETVVAVGGGEFADVPRWRPIVLPAGSTLALGPARHGCRGYLAVAGGIAVEPVLGSRSTYVRAELGGWHGRGLREGDTLPLPDVRRHVRNHWWIDGRILPHYGPSPVVRVVRGAQADEFDAAWLAQTYKVSPQSDRMGVRLQGPALVRRTARDLVSSPVAPGTVQVPPDGQPIVLLADAQTIGGYPQVGHVASVDLPLVAQLRPGDAVQFREIPLDEARALVLAREKAFGLLHEGLAQKLL